VRIPAVSGVASMRADVRETTAKGGTRTVAVRSVNGGV
jgi:hypothetical protein